MVDTTKEESSTSKRSTCKSAEKRTLGGEGWGAKYIDMTVLINTISAMSVKLRVRYYRPQTKFGTR